MGTKEIEISELALFRGLPRRDIDWIAKVADVLDVGAGSVLAIEGKRAREFIVVVDGVASGVNRAGDVLLGPGAYFGDVELLDKAPYRMTVEARSSMRLLVFEQRVFHGMLERLPGGAARLLARMAESLRRLDATLEEVAVVS